MFGQERRGLPPESLVVDRLAQPNPTNQYNP
jgi:hypothetical protein